MLVHGRSFQSSVIDILCDRCGKTCRIRIERINWLRWLLAGLVDKPAANFSYMHLIARWPYGSPKDTEQHEAYICEECYDELKLMLEAWGLKITVSDYPLWP
jgi:hypothetical protein